MKPLRVLVIGAGRVGRMLVSTLANSAAYRVSVLDSDARALKRAGEQANHKTAVFEGDVGNERSTGDVMKGHDCVIAATPYTLNTPIATQAIDLGLSYFGLTEDAKTAESIRGLGNRCSSGQFVAPQCGLAPGFVSIMTNRFVEYFDDIREIRVRVGALPQDKSINRLGYSLTWSTEGLLNEYNNPCEVVENGLNLQVSPMRDLEHLIIDGIEYEAFNTSGGLGTLCETFHQKYPRLQELNYKTLRYPGHCELMRFLIHDLKLGKPDSWETLQQILENAIPATLNDIVVMKFSVRGLQGSLYFEETIQGHIAAPDQVPGNRWSAIQLTTVAGLCGVLDAYRRGLLKCDSGFVKQEDVPFDTFITCEFTECYRTFLNQALRAPHLRSMLPET